jgi:hypothetical protein
MNKYLSRHLKYIQHKKNPLYFMYKGFFFVPTTKPIKFSKKE